MRAIHELIEAKASVKLSDGPQYVGVVKDVDGSWLMLEYSNEVDGPHTIVFSRNAIRQIEVVSLPPGKVGDEELKETIQKLIGSLSRANFVSLFIERYGENQDELRLLQAALNQYLGL